MSFAEKGDVADIDPAFFVGYLHRLKATGTLKFEDAPIQRAVYFRDGRVLFSSSNAPEDQLGAILVAGGKIKQEQFDSMVASLEPKQSIAAALAQGGLVSQRDIGDAARRKVEQIVGACCAQTSGRYEFEDGVLPKGALDLKLTTEKVLTNAFEVLEPSGFLIRVLKSPMAVLAAAEVEPTDPELARVREALDGVSSLADVGGKLGLPLPATEARAAVLVVIGAASVVTSQIEEMSLPDTGETATELPAMDLSDDSEQIEAQTIAFGQSPLTSETSETIAFGDSPVADALNLGSADATLVMPQSPEGAYDGSADSTLVMGSGLDSSLSASPSDSGSIRGFGGIKSPKATSQDLDAVKELIDSPAPPRPGSASIPSQRWEPKLSAEGRPSRGRGGLGGLIQSPIFKRVAALVLLIGVGAVAWMAYSASQARNATRPLPPAVTPAPTQAPSTIAPFTTPPSSATPPLSGASVTPIPGPAASVTPLPKTTPKPVATPAPLVAVVKATPLPTPLATPPSGAKPTPAQPPVATPPVTAKPTGTGSGGGYEALKAGRLAEAEAGFETVARSHSADFSVQLLVACSTQTVEKAIQNDPSRDLFILPATISGKPCHRLMRGYFKTNAEATQAVSTLPAYYVAEGAKPRAVPVKAVLR